MRTHIDWLTFTMSPRYGLIYDDGTSTGDDYATAIEQAWLATFDAETLAGAFGGEWEKQEKSRAPYTDSWALPSKGIVLFAGISLNHCCVEISGNGCEILIEKDLLSNVLASVKERVTRIDIACDIETDVQPLEFVSETSHKRMRSGGHQESASGETRYVGSRKSERFARVYRYNKPHPRAHLLRVEHVFHKAYAKTVVQATLDSGIDAVSASAGKAFGWSHAVWDIQDTNCPDISIATVERNAGGTVFWLCTSVAPAFKRLCDDGTITEPEAFLKRFFLSDNKDA